MKAIQSSIPLLIRSIVFLLISRTANAQSHSPEAVSDVIHYDFTLEISGENNEIRGLAENTVRAIESSADGVLALDLIGRREGVTTGMQVSEVSMGGVPVEFQCREDKLRIELKRAGKPPPPDARLRLAIRYSGIPADGKCLTKWRADAPLPTKVMIMGAARFAVQHLGEVNGTPIQSWVCPQDRDRGFRDLARTANVLKLSEKFPLLPMIDTRGGHSTALLTTNTYQKGGWVLHMLRKKLEDGKFFAGLKQFHEVYRGKNSSTSDFRKAMEAVSEVKLEAFFAQWLDRLGRGVPTPGLTRVPITFLSLGYFDSRFRCFNDFLNLAKVEVVSPNLITRSVSHPPRMEHMQRWSEQTLAAVVVDFQSQPYPR